MRSWPACHALDNWHEQGSILDAGTLIKNNATSKFDDVLLDHDGGLPHVLPLAVHLNFFLVDKYKEPF